MTILSSEAFEKAKHSILQHARPLEQALYRYYFEEKTEREVLFELACFQNNDGGFGNALEPDMRAPESSALATSVALDILQELRIPAEHPLVESSIAYLLTTYNAEREVWRIIPENAKNSPHAPWWNQNGLEETFDHFLANPRAELLGYLYAYQSLVPPERLEHLRNVVLAHFDSLPEKISGDALLCFVRLSAAQNLPENVRQHLQTGLTAKIAASIEIHPDKWEGYCLKPLWAVSTPDSPLYNAIAEHVERNLDYEITAQCEDGSWTPNWTWGSSYPDVWKTAEQEWRGVLTLRTLRAVKAFGRL